MSVRRGFCAQCLKDEVVPLLQERADPKVALYFECLMLAL